MWKKVLPTTLLLSLLFAPIVGSAASEASLTLSNTGVIDYTSSSNPAWVPSDATTWFYTDFSTTQKIIEGDSLKFSDFPNHYINNNVPDECWTFENILEKRALKITWGNTLIVDKANPRPAALIYDPPEEYWIQTEIYLPPDFKLNRWLSLGQPFLGKQFASSTDYPTTRFSTSIFLVGSEGDGTGEIRVQHEVNYHTAQSWNSSTWTKTQWANSGLKYGLAVRGQTMVIKAHVKIHPTDGILELWINNEKLTDYQGQTQTQEPNQILPFQQYKDVDEPVTSIYWRNIQIWAR